MKTLTESQAKECLKLVKTEIRQVNARLTWGEEKLKMAQEQHDYIPAYPALSVEYLQEEIVRNERFLAKFTAIKEALGG